MGDVDKLLYYQKLAENFLGPDIPWKAATGPAGWQRAGLGALPLYALEIDTMRLSATRLLKQMSTFKHDAETASGGTVRVGYTNSIGFAVWFDERGYPAVDIVAELAARQFVMIMGEPGAGKTALLNHVITAKQATETVVLYPKKLRAGSLATDRIIGPGGDYEAIEAELNRWFTLAHNVTEDDPVRHLVCDDWTVTLDVKPELAELPFKIAKLGRAGNLHLTLIVHTDTAAGLYLTGKAQLKRAFVLADLREVNGRRFGFLDYGDGHRRYFAHPGIWQATAKRVDPFAGATQADWVLARLAVQFNDEYAGVRQLQALAKLHFPDHWTAPNGRFTDWKIQTRLEDWDQRGWLLARSTVTEQRRLAPAFATWAQTHRGV